MPGAERSPIGLGVSSMAIQPSLDMGELTPTLEEIDRAQELRAKRVERSRWRLVEPNSDVGRAYRTACAVVADQWDGLEKLLAPQFTEAEQFGKAAKPTPVRDAIRKNLLAAAEAKGFETWATPLHFYPGRALIEFRWPTPAGVLAMRFVCVRPDSWATASIIAMPMTGESSSIHSINGFVSRDSDREGFLEFDAGDGTVEDYIRFFNAHIIADGRFFHLVEGRSDFLEGAPSESVEGRHIYGNPGEAVVAWVADRSERNSATGDEGPVRIGLDGVMPLVIPITRMVRGGRTLFAASLIYGDALFHAAYRVTENGVIEMVNDFPCFDRRPLSVRPFRSLNRTQEALRFVTAQVG